MAGLFEALESRQLLATFTVTNLNDAGAGSLRQAITDANALSGADVIQFADAAVGVITLTSQLSVTGSLAITGRDGLEISGGDTTRVFDFASAITASMSDLTIRNGRSTSAAGILNAGSLTLQGVTLSNNAVSAVGAGAGGAILNSSSGTLVLTNCLITGNSATGTTSGNGAGISNSGTLTVTNSTISSNTATNRGGGILNTGTATILGTTLSNNLAYNTGGGAIMDLGGELQIVNSTLSGNGTDEDGGAILLSLGSIAEIHNSTISANNALDLGDGICVEASSSLLLMSSIVAANGTADISGTLASGSTNNLVKDATDNGGLVNGVDANLVGVDPLLGALADNGGPTHTHALLAGSPAINAGADASGQATTDQRGPLFARTGAPDIGAYEILTLAVVVDSLGDTEDGDFSAGNISLREAIDATNGNPGTDSIIFAPALNSGTIVLVDSRLSILDDLSITGPGAALLEVTPSSEGGFFIEYDTAVLIQGLNISDGYAPGEEGAGIYNRGDLTLSNAILSNNRAGARAIEYNGGALYNDSPGTVTISNSQFTGNSAADNGGAIYNDGTMTISGSSFSGNMAGGDGGAIFNSGAMTISGSTISGGSAGSEGGGICASAPLTIINSTVSGNTAVLGGGIVAEDELTLRNSTVSGNTATSIGGGIAFAGTPVLISGSTISENSAPTGAGIYAESPGSVSNSTITANTSTSGDGIGIRITVSGSLTLVSTIVSGHAGADIDGTLASGSTNNVIEDTATAGGLTNGVNGNLVGVDPLLGPLANNGGPTRTHRLLAASPAINTGANPEALTTDQRGFQRVRGTAIDIGAVEFIGGPSIASFTPPTSSLPLGLSVLLTAGGVADPDGSVAGVRFYLDANANGIGEPGELLLNDTNAADGFSYLYETDADDPIGSKRFLAVGYDEDGTNGAARLATISVTEPDSIGSPVGSANSINVHRVATVNTLGHVLVYREGWTYEDITEKTGAPVATSPAITWIDPKNGLAFVAATSASGLLLFTRSASGTWSFRNLSTETGATASPSGNLTHFISQRQKIVVIAGITDAGRVVAFRQALTATSPGVHAYSFIDISGDLESQGQTTPDLTGLTSYVPKWDTWHLAGVDTVGRIQSIWINTNNPAFTKWRTDNLSIITGAPALSGQLAVTLTAWGGINLTGLDTAGNMLTTWWVPRFGGQWAVSNLTTRYSGPQLVGGNLTAYTTPWGGINYVGLDSAGDVRVYWWVPSFGGTWAISRLLPSSTPDESVPTGRLTSHASAAGTLNVFGTNSSGDVLRLAWQPGPGSAWTIENLTEIATEV